MFVAGWMKRFPCGHGEQFELIGQFWDEMRRRLPDAELCGVGYGWENDTLCYLIGRLNASPERHAEVADAKYLTLALPEDGWETWKCGVDALGETYAAIYAVSRLDYEIEFIGPECTLMIHRVTR